MQPQRDPQLSARAAHRLLQVRPTIPADRFRTVATVARYRPEGPLATPRAARGTVALRTVGGMLARARRERLSRPGAQCGKVGYVRGGVASDPPRRSQWTERHIVT